MPELDATTRLQDTIRDLGAAKQTLMLLDAAETAALETREAHDSWHRERARAIAEIDRLEKLIIQLREQLDRETLEADRAKGAAQLLVNEALARRSCKELPPLVENIIKHLHDLALADIETAKINARLPADEHIKSADTLARARDARPRENIKEVSVDLWCYASNGKFLPDQRVVISRDDGSGYIPSLSSDGGIRCVRLKHRCVSYYPAQDVQRVEPLYTALRLPHFDGPGFAWQGKVTNPAAVLDARSHPPAEEQLLTEYVLAEPFEPPVEHSRHRRPAGSISF